jgi:hypothetical protein
MGSYLDIRHLNASRSLLAAAFLDSATNQKPARDSLWQRRDDSGDQGSRGHAEKNDERASRKLPQTYPSQCHHSFGLHSCAHKRPRIRAHTASCRVEQNEETPVISKLVFARGLGNSRRP